MAIYGDYDNEDVCCSDDEIPKKLTTAASTPDVDAVFQFSAFCCWRQVNEDNKEMSNSVFFLFCKYNVRLLSTFRGIYVMYGENSMENLVRLNGKIIFHVKTVTGLILYGEMETVRK